MYVENIMICDAESYICHTLITGKTTYNPRIRHHSPEVAGPGQITTVLSCMTYYSQSSRPLLQILFIIIVLTVAHTLDGITTSSSR